MFSLKDKVAVVTGGGSGVGLATVKRFVEVGAKVVIADISDQQEMALELGCTYVKVDVSNEDDVKHLFEIARETYGKIDICVNNAGIIVPGEMLEDASMDEYLKVYKINFGGVLYGLKHAPPNMNDGGSIINTASLAGKIGFPGYGAYCSTKGSVIQLTRVAALELAERNIRVNCVCPSTIDTPMAHAKGNELELMLKDYVWPLARLCKAEEVAAMYHFLAADDCTYLTGTAIDLDGGYKAGTGMNAIGKLTEGIEL
ncbi:SDR family oxidoreductase [Photobacterium kagoshimensis]|uniref:SDR family oxidoreductase n=1 Tax=Photobacterium kagoshimensis TaxID=2910242 RepID=UPI003D11583B